MGTDVSALKLRSRGHWLIRAALGLGGVLFVARYVVLGLLYIWTRVDGSISFVIALGMWYLFPMSFAFSYPVVFWCATGLCLTLVVVALLWARPRKVARMALVMVGLVILITPLVYRYRPAVRATANAVLRVPTQPNFLWSAPKAFAAGAEIRRCTYALHGWGVDGALYYTEICGARVSQWRYLPQFDTRMQATTVPDDVLWKPVVRPTSSVAANMPGDSQLQISTRGPVLISPDGVWRAFIARHLYGPEDVVVVSSEIQ